MKERENFFNGQNIARLGLLVGLMLVLDISGIGYIMIGPISITTVHIPVILGAVFWGLPYGLILGTVFGLTSWFKSLQGLSGIFTFAFVNPLISVGMRILMGVVTALIAKAFKDKKPIVAYGVTGALGSILNTVLILGSIFIFYGAQASQALEMTTKALGIFLLGVAGANGIPEAIAAGGIVYAIGRVYRRKK